MPQRFYFNRCVLNAPKYSVRFCLLGVLCGSTLSHADTTNRLSRWWASAKATLRASPSILSPAQDKLAEDFRALAGTYLAVENEAGPGETPIAFKLVVEPPEINPTLRIDIFDGEHIYRIVRKPLVAIHHASASGGLFLIMPDENSPVAFGGSTFDFTIGFLAVENTGALTLQLGQRRISIVGRKVHDPEAPDAANLDPRLFAFVENEYDALGVADVTAFANKISEREIAGLRSALRPFLGGFRGYTPDKVSQVFTHYEIKLVDKDGGAHLVLDRTQEPSTQRLFEAPLTSFFRSGAGETPNAFRLELNTENSAKFGNEGAASFLYLASKPRR